MLKKRKLFCADTDDRKSTWIRPVTPQAAGAASLPQVNPAGEQQNVDNLLSTTRRILFQGVHYNMSYGVNECGSGLLCFCTSY